MFQRCVETTFEISDSDSPFTKDWALSLLNWVLGVLHHNPRFQSSLYFFHTSHRSCPKGGGGV